MACYTSESNCEVINLLAELNEILYNLHSFGEPY